MYSITTHNPIVFTKAFRPAKYTTPAKQCVPLESKKWLSIRLSSMKILSLAGGVLSRSDLITNILAPFSQHNGWAILYEHGLVLINL